MAKTKIYKYKTEIYSYTFYIAISDDPDSILSQLKHIDSQSIEKVVYGYKGLCYPLCDVGENASLIILHPDHIKPGVVAHEASHAAKDLFEYIGAEPSAHETFEYLLGWIVDKCYEAIAKETVKNVKDKESKIELEQK